MYPKKSSENQEAKICYKSEVDIGLLQHVIVFFELIINCSSC